MKSVGGSACESASPGRSLFSYLIITQWRQYMSEFKSIREILETHHIKIMIDNYLIEQLRHKDFTRFVKTPFRIVSGKKQTLCPFHKEKSPSFFIYPNNTYYCFGCGAHGNAIDFLIAQGYSFQDACKTLETL